MLYLVRHAKAGSPRNWEGDDRLRPLTDAGQRQAEALAERFITLSTTSLISSPYLRCVQTLQPIAKMTDVVVEIDECLAEARNFGEVIELLGAVPDGSVLCSHGDVIPDTIGALERRGCRITTVPEWRKASVWVLDRDRCGEVVSAAAWPPPDA